MGRQRWSNRQTVEDCLALDISILASDFRQERRSVFRAHRWFGPSGEQTAIIGCPVIQACGNQSAAFLLHYTLIDKRSGVQTPLQYPVAITATPCRFGGQRYWFICPLVRDGVSCKRRVRKLYLPPGGRYFGCRRCYNLTYRSAQEHDKRLDALLKLSPEEFRQVLTSDNLRHALLAVRASTVLLRRLRKKAARFGFASQD